MIYVTNYYYIYFFFITLAIFDISVKNNKKRDEIRYWIGSLTYPRSTVIT